MSFVLLWYGCFHMNHKRICSFAVLASDETSTDRHDRQDWMHEYRNWTTFRIDGSTPPNERRRQMKEFNEGGNSPNACSIFLLSTRSGGLGINLVAADTVIFYDQDWNPQMDLQAQDRAHRIGQTKPVLVFRLVSNHTVETKIMARASEKRKLEALVIARGK